MDTMAPATNSIRRITPAFGDTLSSGQVMDVLANTLRWDGLAIGASDCGYAVWALPNFPKAMAALDAALNHAATAIPVTVGSIAMAVEYAQLGIIHLRLASQAWPGGLTLVAPHRGSGGRRLAENLHGGSTIGVRISRNPIERQLAAEAGMPITSAAIRDSSGAIVRDYQHAEALVLDGLAGSGRLGTPLVGIPSTTPFLLTVHSTVAATDTSGITIVREGTYAKRDLAAMASRIAMHEHADAT